MSVVCIESGHHHLFSLPWSLYLYMHLAKAKTQVRQFRQEQSDQGLHHNVKLSGFSNRIEE